ncbi:MAG: hypothetical protein F6J86_07250 [Symploca sp. SIO1B1]|nr:hypothetical protein [Symploca sp. SIO2D2]NER93622.1 hypothetical protein [Symploca sp. SIO1B1]
MSSQFYPLAPKQLIAAWNNTRSYQASPLVQRFDRIEDRGVGFGINLVNDTWSFQINVVELSNYLALDNFFKERDGKPFRLDYDGDRAEDRNLYRVASYQWNWTGNQAWGLNVEILGVQRP